MFAVVVPGRMVQPAVQVPEAPERFLVTLPEAQGLNHISVFLTGVAPFPEGYGATVHLETGKGWQLIGALSNSKPSAIFRLRGTFIPSASSFLSTPSPSNPTPNAHLSASLGFLCEPLANVEAQVAAPSSTAIAANPSSSTAMVLANASAPPDPVLLAQKVAKNLFNAIGSFAQPLPGGKGFGVDLSVVEKWYTSFERKVKMAGVGFLLQED